MTTMNTSDTTSHHISDIQPWWIQSADAPAVQPVKGVHCAPLQVIYVPLENLRYRSDDGYRTDEVQVVYVAQTIRSYGWFMPILMDDNNVVLSGRVRVEAALALRLGVVPAIRISTRDAWHACIVSSVENLLVGDRHWRPEEFEAEADLISGSWQSHSHLCPVVERGA